MPRPLRYSINVSLDGCVDHAADGFVLTPDQHQHAADWIARHDVLLFGRTTYELMQAWRPDESGELPDWIEPWMVPFAHTIGEIRKVVVSTTLAEGGRNDLGWNTEVVDGSDLEGTIRALKEQDGAGIGLGGVDLALQVARLGLIDEYQLVVHPTVVGRGPYLFGGLEEAPALALIDREELPGGVVASRYRPT